MKGCLVQECLEQIHKYEFEYESQNKFRKYLHPLLDLNALVDPFAALEEPDDFLLDFDDFLLHLDAFANGRECCLNLHASVNLQLYSSLPLPSMSTQSQINGSNV